MQNQIFSKVQHFGIDDNFLWVLQCMFSTWIYHESEKQKEFPCKRSSCTSILLNGWYLSHQRVCCRRDDGLFYCHIKAIKARIVITRVLYFEVFLSTLGHKLRYHKALKKEAIDNSDNNSTDFFVQPEIGGHFGPFWALGTSVTTNYKILFLYMHLWLISQDSVRLSTKLFKLYDMRR